MAKILVVDAGEQTQVPFLRGIFTRSLQEAGVSFAEAYRLANVIRKELSDSDLIGTDELRQTVLRHLRKKYAPVVARRYESRRSTPEMLWVRDSNGQRAPFAPGQYRRALESCGLAEEDALRAAHCRIRLSRLPFSILEARGFSVSSLEDRLVRMPYRAEVLAVDYLQAVIRKDGTVSDLTVLSSRPPHFGFEEAACAAVSQWRYVPARCNGEPVDDPGAPVNFGQRPLSSPTVFNFFLPDHQPTGPITDAGLFAPEFQIITAVTAIASAIPKVSRNTNWTRMGDTGGLECGSKRVRQWVESYFWPP